MLAMASGTELNKSAYPSPSVSRFLYGSVGKSSLMSEYPSPSVSTHPSLSIVEFPKVIGQSSALFPVALSPKPSPSWSEC